MLVHCKNYCGVEMSVAKSFFAVLPSNTKAYPPNIISKYKVHLPKNWFLVGRGKSVYTL